MTEYTVETRPASHLVGAGKKVANILWFIFYGLWAGIGIIIMAVGYCCTLIFIPVAIQLFKLPKLVFKPFDKDVNTRFGRRGFLNVCWLIFGGIGIWFSFKMTALFFKLTFIGAPIGAQIDKIAQFAIAPFGAEILSAKEYTSDYQKVGKKHDAVLVMRRAAANTDVEINTTEGKMTIGDYFKSKKAEMEVVARKVVQSPKSAIGAGILMVITLGIAIGVNVPITQAGGDVLGFLYIFPSIFGAWMVWQIVALAAKIYLKAYENQKGFLASKFDDKIDYICYKKYCMMLPDYLGEESNVTKKAYDGTVRGLFRAINDPMSVVEKKEAAPEVTTNKILKYEPVAAQPQVIIQQVAAPEHDKLEDLKKLKGLLDAGIITQEEFDQKKAEILASI